VGQADLHGAAHPVPLRGEAYVERSPAGRRELDTSSITFPPIGLRAKREQEGLLQIPFADLERDSDAKGLTDLAEERLVTDPLNPDTDGDGLLDGNDSLPQVPWTAVMDDGATALGAVLGRISGMKSMAIIHEIPAPGDKLDDFMARARRATLTGERTTFMVADRQDFRSLLTTRRTVVLTADELALAEKKFGPGSAAASSSGTPPGSAAR
jgi:hypothetical protein